MADGPAYVTACTNATGDSRGIYAVFVDATLRRRDRIMSSVSDSVLVVAEGFQSDDWWPPSKGSKCDG